MACNVGRFSVLLASVCDYCVQAWEDWLNEKFEAGMSKEDLDKLRELLCVFDCTYALDKNKAEAIDKAVDIITSVMEEEHGND